MHDRDAEQDCDPAAGATRKCRAQFFLEILRQKQKGKRPPCCSASQPCAACQRQARDEVPPLRSRPALESIGSLFSPELAHERRWQRREPPAKPEKGESFPLLRAPPASRESPLWLPENADTTPRIRQSTGALLIAEKYLCGRFNGHFGIQI